MHAHAVNTRPSFPSPPLEGLGMRLPLSPYYTAYSVSITARLDVMIDEYESAKIHQVCKPRQRQLFYVR
jgi:hypothetical protein